MRCQREQVHRKRGISMVIALVFLLLCTMVGTVVITAATAGIGAVSNERDDARRTLALTSAAEYVSDELQKLKYTASYIERTTDTTTYSNPATEDGVTYYRTTLSESATTYDPTRNTAKLEGSENLFTDATMQDLRTLSDVDVNGKVNAAQTSVSVSLTFTSNAGDTEYTIPTVNGMLTIDADYNAKLVLLCDTDSMTLTFPASVSQKSERADCMSTDPTKSNPYIQTVTESDSVTTEKITETTHTTTVTWGTPTVEKGGSRS